MHNRRLLFILILASGFSALVYEVTWTRHLSLLFGSNMLAVGTVAATFMAGLALGGLRFGARADQSPNPLRLYALLEAGIAVTALLFPLSLGLVSDFYIALVSANPDSSGLTALFRLLFAAAALLPPTVCMGGTIPVLCRFLATRQLGGLVGRLYALNTLGAVAGCLLGGFLLIPHFGMQATQAIAIVVNLLIAALAWRLSSASNPAVQNTPVASVDATTGTSRLLLTAAAVLGASALAYEMLWTRLFLLFLGNTTYAFSTILGVFLIGLTAGGALYARWLAAHRNPAGVYLALLCGMLLFILATLPFYDQLAFLFESIHRHADGRWWILSTLSFLIVALPVLVPAAFSGALFPATVTMLQADPQRAGTTVGSVLFWNTLGAMAGSFIGVYAIKLFGLQIGFKAIAVGGLLLAAVLFFAFRATLPSRSFSALLVGIVILLCLPAKWDQGVLNSGIYIYSHYYLNSGGLGSARSTLQPQKVVEGIETTAAFFVSPDGYKEFRVNGKSDGGTRPGDMKTQILLGQLPMLFRPAAKNVLVIGLGTGITLQQTLDYPASRIDCAEISPEVVAIADHFAEDNGKVLESPRINLMVRDGRNLLLTRDTDYDVIISEPSNPWQTGNANLFTREFYQSARASLSKDGIFCQWLPLYDLPTPRLQIALKTFASSFPQVRMFLLGGDMILLGSTAKLDLELGTPAEGVQVDAISRHLIQAGVPSRELLIERYYFGDAEFLNAASANAPLNTDNLPHLEFTHQSSRDQSRRNLQFLVNVRQGMKKNNGN